MRPSLPMKKLLFAVLVLFVWNMIPSCKSEVKKEAAPPPFKVMEIKAVKVPLFIQTVGQAVGIPTVEIRARVAGYLRTWDFREGSIVNKGQTLFTIEQDEYINNLASAKADLDNKNAAWEKAKLDVARLKPLLSTNAISQNDFDKAVTTEQQDRAAVANAKANLDQSKLNLSYTTMPSPITGAVGACNVNPGNLVGKGEATLLTTVSAVDPMYVNFQMNETDYLRIMRYMESHPDLKGDLTSLKIYLSMADRQDYDHAGKIDFVDRQVNATTGTIAMRAVIPNPQGLIKPGNFTTVNIILMELDNGIVIPQSATTQIQGKAFVFMVDKDNKVNRIPVILGRSIGQNFMIMNGLKPGDRIMLEGFQKFKEGMQINPEMVTDTITVPARP
ncbi:MAG: efflux RND transporter periplasmic adaptor subunit [Bacteroidetes bacterium]|nr:efflux RND transporter periplasmic adaptor subunit [Bacteroidota bacterium]